MALLSNCSMNKWFKSSIIASVLLLSGCSYIPSFWDDNESRLAVDVRFAVTQLDCSVEYQDQVKEIKDSVDLFAMYSESRGSDDIGEIVGMMKETVDGFYKDDSNNTFFCNMKKKILVKQSAEIADAVMGRY